MHDPPTPGAALDLVASAVVDVCEALLVPARGRRRPTTEHEVHAQRRAIGARQDADVTRGALGCGRCIDRRREEARTERCGEEPTRDERAHAGHYFSGIAEEWWLVMSHCFPFHLYVYE